MSEFEILITFFVLTILFIIATFFHYRWSKAARLEQLKKRSFQVFDKVDSRIIKQLQEMSYGFMDVPYLGIGVKSTYNGLLVWWYGKLKQNNKEVHIWCYRKAEGHGSSAREKWWFSININGYEPNINHVIIRKAHSLFNNVNFVNEKPDSLFINYPRPLFDFSPTLILIDFLRKEMR